ncbi:transcriptional regulator BetI [Aliiroseovarius sp. Z3]|uniref:choline-binding transcriptional repressor BetI n=1 Tax=Aliiroseovarius sp. Z3 TaxID=2811402 RepID=UPI0023B31D60|nr:transcriptional regulator BetI [Aliiroseovarius sp. Z3]MDE9450872.1 transcriptional regulator BetI [Aliiroseovarius sp. Z3]
MPKVGMEPIRRGALVQATIHEIGRAGSLDVTVTQIAKRAGVSSALAHHYFGGKEQIFLAAMRHILTIYGAQVRVALFGLTAPRDRLEAIIRANFEAGNFRPEVISAWLNFYVLSQSNDGARRLLRVYQHRLHSNLVHALRPLVGDDAHDVADTLASMIDGLYIRHALREDTPSGARACNRVLACLDVILETYA